MVCVRIVVSNSSELLDRVPPIHQDALLAIDERYVRCAATRCDETRVIGKHAMVAVQLANIDDVRASGAFVNRQFQFATVGGDQSISFLGHGYPFLCRP
jgi:hypothetical protein